METVLIIGLTVIALTAMFLLGLKLRERVDPRVPSDYQLTVGVIGGIGQFLILKLWLRVCASIDWLKRLAR